MSFLSRGGEGGKKNCGWKQRTAWERSFIFFFFCLCVGVHVCLSVYVWVLCMSVWIHLYICVYVYLCMYILCMCMYVRVCLNTYMCMCVCVCVSVHACTCIFLCICVCVWGREDSAFGRVRQQYKKSMVRRRWCAPSGNIHLKKKKKIPKDAASHDACHKKLLSHHLSHIFPYSFCISLFLCISFSL